MSSVNFYTAFTEKVADGTIDLDTDDFYIMLLADTYTYSGAHDFRNDVEGDEISGTGYTSGGQQLTSVTWSSTAGSPGYTTFDAADPSWASSTITARYAVIYKNRGGASSADELVLVYDFGKNESSSGTEFKITFPSNGIFRLRQG